MEITEPTLSASVCQKARIARDARFDGLFFIAVKTTGIFCRPICPALPPKEHNVQYFTHAVHAARAGFRPCLRCRPDSAPNSCAWIGTDTTVNRALRLIDAGALSNTNLDTLAARLGISSRYLRKLFSERLGISPKTYVLFKQVMFAKQLLHETTLPISEVAGTAGFNSVRRFNDEFKKQLNLKPSDIRRRSAKPASQRPPSSPSQRSSQPGSQLQSQPHLQLSLAYRPPLDWQAMIDFWRERSIDRLEWVEGNRYGRSFRLLISPESGVSTTTEVKTQTGPNEWVGGWFEVCPLANKHALTVNISIDRPECLRLVVQHIRRILDLDADINTIEKHLKKERVIKPLIQPGIRIPGIWHAFEAGIRAILGQQVSVAAARTHVQRLVAELGEPVNDNPALLHFPAPKVIALDALTVLRIPMRRRDTVRDFARWFSTHGEHESMDQCLNIKGIGHWTVAYVKLRALNDPDIWLAGDLGIKKALSKKQPFDSDRLKPWRSYATFQLWRSLS